MEKIIEIDLNNKYDLIDKYNEKKISNEIIEYIIKQAKLLRNKQVKIIINNNCHIDKDITRLIKEGLKEEYDRSLEEHHTNNVKQILFLILGITFIFLSTLIDDGVIWKEVLLISGWVPIWEMIEVELFPDVDGRRKRKLIKRLLHSEIVVENIEQKESMEVI